MVIQPKMSSKAIVEVWDNTLGIFEQYNIPLVDQALDKIVGGNVLDLLIAELNKEVGSSHTTCIDGG